MALPKNLGLPLRGGALSHPVTGRGEGMPCWLPNLSFIDRKNMFINGYQRRFPRHGIFKAARAGGVNVRGYNR